MTHKVYNNPYVVTISVMACLICGSSKRPGAKPLQCSKIHMFHEECLQQWKTSQVSNETNLDTPTCSNINSIKRLMDAEAADDLHCTICLDPLHSMSMTNCPTGAHIFHSNCIQTWITTRKQLSEPINCPNCRHDPLNMQLVYPQAETSQMYTSYLKRHVEFQKCSWIMQGKIYETRDYLIKHN